MMKNKKWLALLLSAAMLVPVAFAGCGNGDKGDTPDGDTGNVGDTNIEAEDTSTKLTGKIYLVGDSTVCSFSDNYYLPRYGYGTQLYNYINCDSNQIVNLALSGRSSLSFITESNYTTLKNSISEGDYLIIGFGHNDEKSDDAARYTSPSGDKTTAGSFQKSLYDNYVKLAEDKGATPILCTPIVRYDSSGSYSGTKVHVTSDGDYSAAILALGEDTNTTVVDLTKTTKSLYMSDNTAAAYLHAHTTYDGEKPNETPAGRDDTHINMYGAKMVAYQFAQEILKSDSTLKSNVKTNSKAPTKEVDYVAAINSSYAKPDYAAFDPNTTTAMKLTKTTTNETSVDWYGSYMGNVSGSNYTTSYSNNVITVADNGTSPSGKIASEADGFGAAFVQIDITKNFTASATVTVKSYTVPGSSSNQTAFGMMLRDDIYVNTKSDSLASNYVAAGILNTKGAIFSRESGKLSGVANSITSAVKANDTYELEITRLGQAVTVKIGSYSKTYTDFDFVAVDNDYIYLCLFANRGIVAEFSNIRFEITGEAQGA